MSTDTPSESITALLAYSQADEEGIIVTVSRQAIHEVVRENARLREEVEMLNVRHAASMLHAQTHADEYNALREDEKGLLQDIQRLTEEAFKRDEELAIQSNANVGLMEELADRNHIRCANCHANPDMECEPLKQCREELAEAKREIDRLNQWADSFTDAHLKERQTGDALVKETLQRAEQAEARALAAEKDSGRRFPMQGGPSIPWSLAKAIYAGYSSKYGEGQSLERLAERGGFGWAEVEIFYKENGEIIDAAIGAKHD